MFSAICPICQKPKHAELPGDPVCTCDKTDIPATAKGRAMLGLPPAKTCAGNSDLNLRTSCHPEAAGRKPVPGERQWIITLPLEDGRQLQVSMGAAGWETLTNHLIDMLSEAPSHNDGTCGPNRQPTDTERLNAIERIGIELVPRRGQWNCLIADGPRSQAGVSCRKSMREAIDLAVFQLLKAGVKSAEL